MFATRMALMLRAPRHAATCRAMLFRRVIFSRRMMRYAAYA